MKKVYTVIFLFFLSYMSGYAQEKIQVIFFLLDDCTICESYTIKINELHAEHGETFDFIGYFPNFSSKKKKIEAFKNRYNIGFPLKTDYFHKQVDRFDIKVTPEVIVYNPEENHIYYKGRIDNEFVRIGKRRQVVTTSELSDVLASLGNGDLRTFESTESIGCFINKNDPLKNIK